MLRKNIPLICFMPLTVLIFLPSVSFSKTDQTMPKNVIEIAKKQREAEEKFAKINEELNQHLVHVICDIYDDKTPCVDFVTVIKNQAELQNNFRETLSGEVLILSTLYNYNSKTCEARNGKLYANPEKEPAAVLSCLKSNPEQTTVSDIKTPTSNLAEKVKIEENVSLDNLRKLEKKFRMLAESINFAVGVDTENNPNYSSSAFVVDIINKGRKVPFIITAGHVAGHFNVNYSKIHIFKKGSSKDIIVSERFQTSEVLDIAAIKVPLIRNNILPGIIRTDELPAQTPIAVLCNPLYFGISVRTGFFSKVYEIDKSLSLEFPGIGVENNCSGSPVIDEQGHIIGMFRSLPSGRIAYAIPITKILEFIKEIH